MEKGENSKKRDRRRRIFNSPFENCRLGTLCYVILNIMYGQGNFPTLRGRSYYYSIFALVHAIHSKVTGKLLWYESDFLNSSLYVYVCSLSSNRDIYLGQVCGVVGMELLFKVNCHTIPYLLPAQSSAIVSNRNLLNPLPTPPKKFGATRMIESRLSSPPNGVLVVTSSTNH